jgi:DNA-binding beta-propeller fold protein YncE
MRLSKLLFFKLLRVTAMLAISISGFAQKGFAQEYKVTSSIPIAGEGGWDYLYADSGSRMLYVSHNAQVDVVDMDSGKPVFAITGMKHIHGIAIAHDLGRGFISDGGDNVIVIFDLVSRAILQKVPAGTNPDGIVYDPATKRLFAFNGRSKDVTAIEGATGQVAGTIALDGKPEFPVTDGAGNIYDNIEDKSEIVRIDPHTLKVTATWPLAPCDEPSGLAYDSDSKRLFSVCDNQKMAVVNTDTGKVVTTVTVGNGPDATFYYAEKKLVFSPNGEDGTLTVLKQESADKYSVADTVKAEKSGRTMALDTKTGKIYIAAAQFGPTPAPTATEPHPRPTIVSGSFHLVVLSPQ